MSGSVGLADPWGPPEFSRIFVGPFQRFCQKKDRKMSTEISTKKCKSAPYNFLDIRQCFHAHVFLLLPCPFVSCTCFRQHQQSNTAILLIFIPDSWKESIFNKLADSFHAGALSMTIRGIAWHWRWYHSKIWPDCKKKKRQPLRSQSMQTQRDDFWRIQVSLTCWMSCIVAEFNSVAIASPVFLNTFCTGNIQEYSSHNFFGRFRRKKKTGQVGQEKAGVEHMNCRVPNGGVFKVGG